MVGTALACDCGPADNLALFGALSVARPGDILIAASGSYTGAAVTGDLLLGMARNRGVAGFVTDDMVRDAVGLPVDCAGVTPNSPARRGPGTVGQPIDLGGACASNPATSSSATATASWSCRARGRRRRWLRSRMCVRRRRRWKRRSRPG